MSAIAGIYYMNDQNVNSVELQDMLNKLNHCGSDKGEFWFQNNIGFGSQMLRTTPESINEKFPMFSDSQNLVLFADARIDNRKELINTLGIKYAASEMISDGRIILIAYEKWGYACPNKLKGAFAFSIWDSQKKELFCARDHFGQRAFYYYYLSDNLFAFATEIKAIFCIKKIPKIINETRIAEFLSDLLEDRTITFYENIMRLPPANYAVIKGGHMVVKQYWQADAETELMLASNEEYAEKFREIFTQAIRSNLRSNAAIGISLSGGIDSSSIACVACLDKNQIAHLKGFSLLYDSAPNGDEKEYISSVLEHTGIDAFFVKADDIKPFSNLEKLFYHFDEPFDNPYFPVGWALWEKMREQDIHIALDGVDGDATFSYDYMYLTELAKQGKWKELAKESVGLSRYYFQEKISPISIFLTKGVRPLLPKYLQTTNIVLQPIGVGGLVKQDFATRTHLLERIDEMKSRRNKIKTFREYHAMELSHGVMAYALEGMNKLGAAFAIEPRHPFFDKDLIDFAIALPREQKILNGWTRIIIRRALADILPEKVILYGHKWGPGEFFANMLIKYEDDVLCDLADNDILIPYVDLNILKKTVIRLKNNPNSKDAYSVALVAILAMWLSKACI